MLPSQESWEAVQVLQSLHAQSGTLKLIQAVPALSNAASVRLAATHKTHLSFCRQPQRSAAVKVRELAHSLAASLSAQLATEHL